MCSDSRGGLQIPHLLLPPVCLICGDHAQAGLDCCAGCEQELAVNAPGCRQCALPLSTPVAHCGRCSRRPPAFERSFAAFHYDSVVESLIHRFKFRRHLAAGKALASLAARRFAAVSVPRPQALVPVPLHWRRRLGRGFNQSELLARDLSSALGGIPVSDVLVRRRATPAQLGLPAAHRRGNVRGAFSVRLPGCTPEHLALVDDVMTTGATLEACALVLRRAGVARVDVWVIARA